MTKRLHQRRDISIADSQTFPGVTRTFFSACLMQTTDARYLSEVRGINGSYVGISS